MWWEKKKKIWPCCGRPCGACNCQSKHHFISAKCNSAVNTMKQSLQGSLNLTVKNHNIEEPDEWWVTKLKKKKESFPATFAFPLTDSGAGAQRDRVIKVPWRGHGCKLWLLQSVSVRETNMVAPSHKKGKKIWNQLLWEMNEKAVLLFMDTVLFHLFRTLKHLHLIPDVKNQLSSNKQLELTILTL